MHQGGVFVLEFFRRLFESDFMPHGYCFAWRPDILWLNVTSDALIALSYYIIPLALIYLVRARRDIAFQWMFTLFGLFILSCGTTHVLGIVTLWHPVYRLEGVVKAVTALASLPTAVMLVWLTPRAIALPSPQQLRNANEALKQEIAERKEAQAQVWELNRDLEHRVAERTADLERSNQMLREANERLAQAESRYRELFESNPLPMWVREPETGRVLAVNPAAVELYGYSQQEFLSMSASELQSDGSTPGGNGSPLQPRVERHIRKNRPPIFAEVRFREMMFDTRPAMLVLSSDVTERKVLEEQLRHSQKMEAVGRLAGGIAHDFNNLLTVILGYAKVLCDRLAPEDGLRRMVDEIRRAGEQAASLTGQLLAFSRKQITEPHLVHINDVVEQTQEILKRLIGEDVSLAVVLDKTLGGVKSDEGQLTQVLLNLAVNARDAMPNGGKLTIETHAVTREREDQGLLGVRPAGRFALLVVSDTGTGMDPEVQGHIFEPFFTTKETGKGTGLGLSTVYGIVRQAGGWIDVYSEPGHGSAFRVYLPLADEAVVPAAPAPVRAPARRNATILLVEDQAPVRMLAEDVLTEGGHKVLSAANGRAALEKAENYSGKIDLLITDVVMPEMNGPDLVDRLSRSRPGLAVLYISGYTDHALLHRGTLDKGAALLEKPFLPESLLKKVDELLA